MITQIRDVVSEEEVMPEEYSEEDFSPFHDLLAPFELGRAEHEGEEKGFYCCPNCLEVKRLDGYEVDFDSVTVNHSVGCSACAFNCNIEDGELEPVDPWPDADDRGDATYRHRMFMLHRFRSEVHQELIDDGYEEIEFTE